MSDQTMITLALAGHKVHPSQQDYAYDAVLAEEMRAARIRRELLDYLARA